MLRFRFSTISTSFVRSHQINSYLKTFSSRFQSSLAKPRVDNSPPDQAITLTFPSGIISSFPYLFLLDSDQSSRSINPGTQQRNFKFSDLPPAKDLKVISTEFVENGKSLRGGEKDWDLVLHWNQKFRHIDGADTTLVSRSFLEKFSSPKTYIESRFVPENFAIPWNVKDFSAASGQVHFSFNEYIDSAQPYTYNKVISNLMKYGLVFLKGVPTQPSAGQYTLLRNVAEKMGEVRTTIYDDLFDGEFRLFGF
jgi:gamma-butyrobetaine dioxygenase